MPPSTRPSNGLSEIYGRVSSLEAGLQSLQTELSGYAKHTTDAISALTDQIDRASSEAERRLERTEGEWRDNLRATVDEFQRSKEQSRPNWYALAAVVISLVVAMGSLVKNSVDAQVRPNTLRSENNALRISTLTLETKQDLRAAQEHLRDMAQLYREANTMAHSEITRRIQALEDKMAVRSSDEDDRQDAEIQNLKKMCDLLIERLHQEPQKGH